MLAGKAGYYENPEKEDILETYDEMINELANRIEDCNQYELLQTAATQLSR